MSGAVRLLCINNQPWLDEVWSIRLAQQAKTPWGVFTLHHDNNHYLNTLYLLILGPGAPWWSYHLLSVAAGTATVWLAMLLVDGVAAQAAVAIFTGLSEFQIEFSDQARGYALAGFFTLACLLAYLRWSKRPSYRAGTVFALFTVLGILSHLTFVVVIAGLGACFVAGAWRDRIGLQRSAKHGAALFAPSLFALTALYVIDLRKLQQGGGPPTPDDLASQASALFLGMPLDFKFAGLVGLIALLLCAWSGYRYFRAGHPAWPLLATALVFAPAFLFLWPRPDGTYLHPRYVYVALPLLSILLASVIGKGMEIGGLRRWASAAALGAFIAVNAMQFKPFLRYGTGDYAGAALYIRQHNISPSATIATDRHLRSTFMVLQFYDRPAQFRSQVMKLMLWEYWANQLPQWVIAETDLGNQFQARGGLVYELRAVYPTGGVADGITWRLYQSRDGQDRSDDFRAWQVVER